MEDESNAVLSIIHHEGTAHKAIAGTLMMYFDLNLKHEFYEKI